MCGITTQNNETSVKNPFGQADTQEKFVISKQHLDLVLNHFRRLLVLGLAAPEGNSGQRMGSAGSMAQAHSWSIAQTDIYSSYKMFSVHNYRHLPIQLRSNEFEDCVRQTQSWPWPSEKRFTILHLGASCAGHALCHNRAVHPEGGMEWELGVLGAT